MGSVRLQGIPRGSSTGARQRKRGTVFLFLKRDVGQRKKKKKTALSSFVVFVFSPQSKDEEHLFQSLNLFPPLPTHLLLRHDHARQSGCAPAARGGLSAFRYDGHAGAHFFSRSTTSFLFFFLRHRFRPLATSFPPFSSPLSGTKESLFHFPFLLAASRSCRF
jgi:hypothetical protein